MKLLQAKQLREAEGLFRDVLQRQPLAGFDAVAMAQTKHDLGKTLRLLGALDDALEVLKAALDVRDRWDATAGIGSALRDGNLTREEVAKVYEAKGECGRALIVRQEGTPLCSNEACKALEYQEETLQACSRCKCVFYCSKTCQRQDWKSRHKGCCQAVARREDVLQASKDMGRLKVTTTTRGH
uniref:MYND-type domain-containing protein n=1 Tax=Hyaloperonospora arabidopsidis (strain Emoy2) TaxID=559515 RepID=M4BSB4_HYAAE